MKCVLQKTKRQINLLWYRPLVWYATPLLLLSAIYRGLMCLRRYYYRFKKIPRLSVPVIVVGNLTVGGTGKTPLVAWLVRELIACGYHPGIVTRGYRGRGCDYPALVHRDSPVSQVGDEALMLYLQTDCPIIVDPYRRRGALLLSEKYHCNVIVSDDGLQHLNLPRDIEIIVVDGQRGWGNQHCLPVGPLREPISRCKAADFIVINSSHSMASHITISEHTPMMMRLVPDTLRSVKNREIIDATEYDTSHHPITFHAVAGIGNPDRFFETLSEFLKNNINKDVHIVPHIFPDHHAYTPRDFDFLTPSDIVIMTEKDAVKCRDFSDARLYYLPVKALLPPESRSKIIQRLG